MLHQHWFALNKEILTNKTPLLIDVTLYRQDANSNWASIEITIDKVNKLKSLLTDDDDTNNS